MGAGIAAGVARRLALVAAEIVEDGDIAAIEGWCQALLDPDGEGNAVDRAIEHEGARMRSWRSRARKVSVFQ